MIQAKRRAESIPGGSNGTSRGTSPTNLVESLMSMARSLELSLEALFTLKECEQTAMRGDRESLGWGASCSITPAGGKEGREPGMVPREGEPAVITQPHERAMGLPQKIFSRGLASLLCTFWRVTW